MLDYLVAHLEGSGDRVQPVTLDTAQGRANMILVGDNGVVLLCDRTFPHEGFGRLMYKASQGYQRIAPVFFKDGETFFRAKAGEVNYKSDKGLSLKNYTPEEISKMILFRPEEQRVLGHAGGWMQYYQPQSERLNEGLESFYFVPVKYDYSHSDSRFVPDEKDSNKMFLWTERRHAEGKLVLKDRLLASKTP